MAPWTEARQAPPSMGFSRQEYWSGLSFLLQGIFPTQGLTPGLLSCRQILHQLSPQGSPVISCPSRTLAGLGCRLVSLPMDGPQLRPQWLAGGGNSKEQAGMAVAITVSF